jgi:hypothetical protein
MVNIGDEIVVNRKVGIITDIRQKEGRYLICLKASGKPYWFMEGDEDFKIIRENKK